MQFIVSTFRQFKMLFVSLIAVISVVLISLFCFATASDKTLEKKIQTIRAQDKSISPTALRYALKAYYCARRQGLDSQKLLTLVDYSKPSTEHRFYVINMKNDKLLFDKLTAHGSGSGGNFATHFSDTTSSHQSSIGLFKTGNIYVGKHGRSLQLIGLDQGYNNHALSRSVVVHGAWYVSDQFAKLHGRLGRSWGCFALNKDVVEPVISKIKQGSLLFAYYPDKDYLSHSTFLHC